MRGCGEPSSERHSDADPLPRLITPVMKIIRAEHLGMCFGVRDAIALAVETAQHEPLTILGDLVHNETVIAELRQRGVRFPCRQWSKQRSSEPTCPHSSPLFGRAVVCPARYIVSVSGWYSIRSRWVIGAGSANACSDARR